MSKDISVLILHAHSIDLERIDVVVEHIFHKKGTLRTRSVDEFLNDPGYYYTPDIIHFIGDTSNDVSVNLLSRHLANRKIPTSFVYIDGPCSESVLNGLLPATGCVIGFSIFPPNPATMSQFRKGFYSALTMENASVWSSFRKAPHKDSLLLKENATFARYFPRNKPENGNPFRLTAALRKCFILSSEQCELQGLSRQLKVYETGCIQLAVTPDNNTVRRIFCIPDGAKFKQPKMNKCGPYAEYVTNALFHAKKCRADITNRCFSIQLTLSNGKKETIRIDIPAGQDCSSEVLATVWKKLTVEKERQLSTEGQGSAPVYRRDKLQFPPCARKANEEWIDHLQVHKEMPQMPKEKIQPR